MCTLVIHKLVRNGFFMLKLAPQLPQRCWRRCYTGVCNHYCVRECVRERFIFSALFCQLKEIRARKTRRPIGCSSGARSGANCSATEARGVLLQRGPANFMGHTPRVRFASRGAYSLMQLVMCASSLRLAQRKCKLVALLAACMRV